MSDMMLSDETTGEIAQQCARLAVLMATGKISGFRFNTSKHDFVLTVGISVGDGRDFRSDTRRITSAELMQCNVPMIAFRVEGMLRKFGLEDLG